MIGNSNDETNFPHKLLLTDTQVLKICKAFPNGWSTRIRHSKSKLSKIIQSEGILPSFLFIWDPAKKSYLWSFIINEVSPYGINEYGC